VDVPHHLCAPGRECAGQSRLECSGTVSGLAEETSSQIMVMPTSLLSSKGGVLGHFATAVAVHQFYTARAIAESSAERKLPSPIRQRLTRPLPRRRTHVREP